MSAPNAAAGVAFNVGGAQMGTYPSVDSRLDKP